MERKEPDANTATTPTPTTRRPCNLYSVIPAYEYHHFPPSDLRTDNLKSATDGSGKNERRRTSVASAAPDDTPIPLGGPRDSGSIPTLWKKKMVTWFQRWDKDGDGVLTRKDFELLDQAMEEIVQKTNPRYRPKGVWVYMWENFVSPEEPSHIGSVSLDEWINSHYQARMNWSKNPKIAASLIGTFSLLYDAIDVNGDEVVEIDEYKTFFKIMGVDPELAVPAFNRIDYDHDGTLAKDEFLCAVMSYYCDMSPSDVELMDSQFLGPLVDSSETPSFDMIKRWSSFKGGSTVLPPNV